MDYAQACTSFEENGYAVVPGFASSEEIGALRKRMDELVDKFDPKTDSTLSIFTTNEQERTSDDYFLGSSNSIKFFFESGAVNDGDLVVPKSVSLNKCGHALHDVDPIFSKFSRSQRIKDLLTSLGQSTPTPVQSMYIFKQPSIGGEVSIHRDSTFLYTSPETCIGLWFALEDSTLENGCLWAVPGSHKDGPVQRRFKRKVDQPGVEFFGPAETKYKLEEDFVSLPVSAGTLVVLHGSLVHYSAPNTSSQSRHAYSVHYVSGIAEWDKENWLQLPNGESFKAL